MDDLLPSQAVGLATLSSSSLSSLSSFVVLQKVQLSASDVTVTVDGSAVEFDPASVKQETGDDDNNNVGLTFIYSVIWLLVQSICNNTYISIVHVLLKVEQIADLEAE
jgi:hypothetical protein